MHVIALLVLHLSISQYRNYFFHQDLLTRTQSTDYSFSPGSNHFLHFMLTNTFPKSSQSSYSFKKAFLLFPPVSSLSSNSHYFCWCFGFFPWGKHSVQVICWCRFMPKTSMIFTFHNEKLFPNAAIFPVLSRIFLYRLVFVVF